MEVSAIASIKKDWKEAVELSIHLFRSNVYAGQPVIENVSCERFLGTISKSWTEKSGTTHIVRVIFTIDSEKWINEARLDGEQSLTTKVGEFNGGTYLFVSKDASRLHFSLTFK